jgi:hypothetical protein
MRPHFDLLWPLHTFVTLRAAVRPLYKNYNLTSRQARLPFIHLQVKNRSIPRTNFSSSAMLVAL